MSSTYAIAIHFWPVKLVMNDNELHHKSGVYSDVICWFQVEIHSVYMRGTMYEYGKVLTCSAVPGFIELILNTIY